MQVGHQMGQVFTPKIFDGMWVVAFGRQVQQHNGIGAPIGRDRLYCRHTLLVGEVTVAASNTVNQESGSTGRREQIGAVVGFDRQNISPVRQIQEGFGDVAQISSQGKLEIPVFNHECTAHVFVVGYPYGLEFGLGREIQDALVESHQTAVNPDLPCFFLLTAFQNGGHLVGG